MYLVSKVPYIYVKEKTTTGQTPHYKKPTVVAHYSTVLWSACTTSLDQPTTCASSSMVIPFHQLVRPLGGSPTFNTRPIPPKVCNVFLMQLYSYYDFLDNIQFKSHDLLCFNTIHDCLCTFVTFKVKNQRFCEVNYNNIVIHS